MAVRPIDANAMLSELRPVSFEAEHSAVLLSDVSKMMRKWVERQPTLTPPNEALTPCDVCKFSPPSSSDGKPCCMCPAERRPPEGEEELANGSRSQQDSTGPDASDQ